MLVATHDRGHAIRPLELLAKPLSMVEFRLKGDVMFKESERGKRLAQNLVELLAPYEEELIQLERDAPGLGPLRRAIGIAIAEACYCINDRSVPQENLVPPVDDQTSRAS